MITEYWLNDLTAQVFHGFDFMQDLVSDMVQNDPTKRPTIAEVESRFEELSSQLSSRKLRSRLIHRGEDGFTRAVLGTMHFFRTARLIVMRYPPVPIPRA